MNGRSAHRPHIEVDGPLPITIAPLETLFLDGRLGSQDPRTPSRSVRELRNGFVHDQADARQFTHPLANPTKEDVDKNGLNFAGGEMANSGKIVYVAEFVVFNDGIVSISTSTENAEAFLQEIYGFLVSMPASHQSAICGLPE